VVLLRFCIFRGEIKIYAMFQVDTLGNIANVKVRSLNPFLSKEIGERINSILKVYNPGYPFYEKT